MKKLLMILLMLSLALFIGCSEDDDPADTQNDPLLTVEQADSLSEMFLTDVMEELQGVIDDPGSIEDLDLAQAKAGVQLILNDYPDHPEANLAMGIIKMSEIVGDDVLWELADSVLSDFEITVTDRGRIYDWNHPMIAELPQLLISNDRSLPDYLTVPFLQNYLHDNIIPVLGAILGNLEAVEGDPDFSIDLYLNFDDETDTLEIDLGEIYVLDGAMRGLRGVLRLLTAYDADLSGEDGTYDWIDELDDSGYIDIDVAFGGVGEGDTLYIEKHYEANGQVALFQMLQYQLDPASDFLSLRTSPYSGQTEWTGGYNDILGMMGKFETALDVIEAEEDDQGHDLITMELIEFLNDAIGEAEGLPEGVEDIDGVITMVNDILTGPTSIWIYQEDGWGEVVDSLEITFDLSALFDTPVPDWKEKLFYYQWRPENEWVVTDEPYSWTDYPNPDYTYYVYFDGEEYTYENIVRAYTTTYDEYLDQPVDFLDGPDGAVIDSEVPGFFPYFPDYTFGGLFPDVEREDWLELMDFMNDDDD
jgi:hypothetical protein